MRFVEKEDQLGFFRIADLGKIFEQFREHPKQKCRVNFWRLLHQLVRSKNVEHAFLRVVQFEETPENQWPHFGNGRAHGMPVLSKNIPEYHRGGFAFEIRNLQLAHAFYDFRVGTTGLAQFRKSPLTSAINTG